MACRSLRLKTICPDQATKAADFQLSLLRLSSQAHSSRLDPACTPQAFLSKSGSWMVDEDVGQRMPIRLASTKSCFSIRACGERQCRRLSTCAAPTPGVAVSPKAGEALPRAYDLVGNRLLKFVTAARTMFGQSQDLRSFLSHQNAVLELRR